MHTVQILFSKIFFVVFRWKPQNNTQKSMRNWRTVYKWGFKRYDESLWTPLFGCVRSSVILWICVWIFSFH